MAEVGWTLPYFGGPFQMITDLGFLGLGAKHIALDLVSPVVFLSEILGSEKFACLPLVTCLPLLAMLRFAFFASVMCVALAVRPSLLGKKMGFC